MTSYYYDLRHLTRQRDSLVSIVTRLQFGPPGFESHHRFQTVSEVHPTYCPMRLRGSFPGGWDVKLETYSHLVPRLRMHRAIPPLPMHLHGVALS
jgi:hypothetical protein